MTMKRRFRFLPPVLLSIFIALVLVCIPLTTVRSTQRYSTMVKTTFPPQVKVIEVEEIITTTILTNDLTPEHEEFLIRQVISEEEEIALAKCIYGEDRSGKGLVQKKAAVIWCILNRLDTGKWNTVMEVITAPHQFSGYNTNNPVEDWAVELVKDVVLRYELEKLGYEDVGRVLPNTWLFFAAGGGEENRFRETYESREYWDWSLPDPYNGAIGVKMEETE